MTHLIHLINQLIKLIKWVKYPQPDSIKHGNLMTRITRYNPLTRISIIFLLKVNQYTDNILFNCLNRIYTSRVINGLLDLFNRLSNGLNSLNPNPTHFINTLYGSTYLWPKLVKCNLDLLTSCCVHVELTVLSNCHPYFSISCENCSLHQVLHRRMQLSLEA